MSVLDLDNARVKVDQTGGGSEGGRGSRRGKGWLRFFKESWHTN